MRCCHILDIVELRAASVFQHFLLVSLFVYSIFDTGIYSRGADKALRCHRDRHLSGRQISEMHVDALASSNCCVQTEAEVNCASKLLSISVYGTYVTLAG